MITTLSESIAEKDAAYALVVAERDSRFEDTDADGITDIKEIELETDPNVGTVFYLNNTEFETAVASARETGQNDVIKDPLSFGLVLGSTYEAVITERDARFIDTDKDGLTDLKEAELESDNNELTVFYLQDAYELGIESARFEGRTDVTNNPNAYSLVSDAQYNLVVAERDGRPTQEDLAEVIAERDARPTLGEVRDARLGSVVLQSDNANNSVKIRFSIEETDDFKVWTKRDGVNEVTVPLEAGRKFYRFALQDEWCKRGGWTENFFRHLDTEWSIDIPLDQIKRIRVRGRWNFAGYITIQGLNLTFKVVQKWRADQARKESKDQWLWSAKNRHKP